MKLSVFFFNIIFLICLSFCLILFYIRYRIYRGLPDIKFLYKSVINENN